jgi:hypothetical protein
VATTLETRTCEHCSSELPSLSRRDRRYCSTACRVAAARERAREQYASDSLLAPAPLESREVTAQLQAAVEQATQEHRLVAIVAREANKGQWRAAAWLLEHRFPERWGQQRARVAESPPAPASEDDPFLEVDQLAARRRTRRLRDDFS